MNSGPHVRLEEGDDPGVVVCNGPELSVTHLDLLEEADHLRFADSGLLHAETALMGIQCFPAGSGFQGDFISAVHVRGLSSGYVRLKFHLNAVDRATHRRRTEPALQFEIELGQASCDPALSRSHLAGYPRKRGEYFAVLGAP